MTHTYSTLEVPAPVYDIIYKLLDEAGYGHAFDKMIEPNVIDMHGIGLVRAPQPPEEFVESNVPPVVFEVKSPRYGTFSVRTALLRAAFHLKKQGYGLEDVRSAEIIEQLEFKVQR